MYGNFILMHRLSNDLENGNDLPNVWKTFSPMDLSITVSYKLLHPRTEQSWISMVSVVSIKLVLLNWGDSIYLPQYPHYHQTHSSPT